MSKGTTLLKNTLILGFGTISTQFVGFFLLPLYTHYLAPGEYGFVDVVTVFLTLLVPSLTLQLNMASFRFLVDARGNFNDQRMVISNVVSMVLSIAIPIAVALLIVGFIFHIPYIGFIVAAGLAMLYSQQALQMTRGFGNNRQFAIASIINAFVTLIGALVFIVWIELRVEGMFLAVITANLTAAIYLTLRMKLYRYARKGFKNSLLRKELLGYSIPLIPNGVAWWVNNAADRVLIALLIGTAANGFYAVATKFSVILNSFFGVFSMSWTESATMHINDDDRDDFFSLVANSSVRIFGALGLVLIGSMPFIFPLMISDEFNEAFLYIPIMVIGVFFNVLVGMYSAIYIAKKLTKKVMNTSLIAAALNIVLTLCLIPFLELFGASIATTVTFFVMAVIRHQDIKKYVLITYEKRTFVIFGLAYAVVTSLYYLNEIWANILAFAVASLVAVLLNLGQLRKLIGLVKLQIHNR